MEIRIEVPPSFNFKRTIMSHGWCELKPFEFDQASFLLKRVVDLPDAEPVTIEISQIKGAIAIKSPIRLNRLNASQVRLVVRHMLRLDDNMDEFYGQVAADPAFSWIAVEGAGRLLRAPTVFEDLIKMVCTTNCSWALTEVMVNRLVRKLGRKTKDGKYSFPTPEAMARKPESFYRKVVRAGYRGPYLKELAKKVASGELDVEGWLNSQLPGQELKREIKAVKGVGDYTAENMLKLLGRHHGLALDSWVRGRYAKIHASGRAVTDKKIEHHYRRFGDWSGLVLWCDMTRDWL
jgi:3-methyladenine DNA glycosylase/8-oxoguanine DNA glycosylase